jgi:hypothetical protein
VAQGTVRAGIQIYIWSRCQIPLSYRALAVKTIKQTVSPTNTNSAQTSCLLLSFACLSISISETPKIFHRSATYLQSPIADDDHDLEISISALELAQLKQTDIDKIIVSFKKDV